MPRVFYNIIRTDRCGYCLSKKHLASSCMALSIQAERGVKAAVSFQKRLQGITTRLCGYCAGSDHTSSNCEKKFYNLKESTKENLEQIEDLFTWLLEIGFGPGALLSTKKTSRTAKDIFVVEDFSARGLRYFFLQALAKKNKKSGTSFYRVDAVSLENQGVYRMILPFHPHYSYSKSAVETEILQKAPEEEIIKMKMKLKKVMNCHGVIVNCETAEEFFNAGYRFETGSSKHIKIDETLVNANKNLES